VTFKDSFPLEIEFEIDRVQLLRYLQMQARVGCFGLILPISLLFTVSFFNAQMAPYKGASLWFATGWFSIYLICGIFSWLFLGSLLYFSYFHWAAIRAAANVRLLVEGPYLRLVSGGYIVTDQRFHFRDVSSYGTIQGPFLRHYHVESLCFRVHCRASNPPILVAGIVDADRVRDILCEIDASRECLTGSVETAKLPRVSG